MNPLFVPVDVDGHTIEFAVDLSWSHPILGPDPMAGLLATGRFPTSPANELWRHLIHPGGRVVDVGAHLGTYSLPAAAHGAHVLAVEASEPNATLLKFAAERNGFRSVEIVHAAASRRSGTVDFKSAGPWSHVMFETEPAEGQSGTTTAAVVLDELLQARSWEHVDVIKIDIEGSEVEALAGLRTCLASENGPPVIVEANAVALHGYGYAPRDVLAALAQHGYRCYLIDLPPGHRIIPVEPNDLQPETVADYVAFKDVPATLLPWSIAAPLDRREVISRVVATCTHEDIYHREYGARLLAAAPRWLVEDDSIQELKGSLDVARLTGPEHVQQTAERAESPEERAHRASPSKSAGAPAVAVASGGHLKCAGLGPLAASPASPSTSPRPSEQSPDSVGKVSPVSGRRSESNLKRRARRLARPILSPIDGRVADINRRVEHTRTVVEKSVAAYASSSTEASAYVGAELRGLRDQLAALNDQIAALGEQQTALREQQTALRDLVAGLGERSFEEYYQQRLARAADLPIEKLDGPLAQAINDATGSHGLYSRAGLFFNQPVWVLLSQGSAAVQEVNERVVEVPFAMAALSRVEPGARILDVGSAESTFPLSAASLGYRVTAVDPRPLAYSHPNLESHAMLLEDWDGPPGSFVAAFLISTIEHVGLGAYGERSYGSPEHGAGADLALLGRVRELLSPEGLMILTVPYGRREITELERIYDEESLSKLLSDWEVLERQIVARRDALIWEADEKVVTGARGVVMLIASPKQA